MYSSNYLYTCIYSIWSEYLFYVTIHILFDWRNHFTCLYTFFLNKVDMWLYVFDQSNHFMWLYVFCSIRVNSLCGSTYSGYFYYLIYWGRYILCLVTQSSDCLLSLAIYIVYTEICNILIAEKVLSVLLQFSTSYLCDLGFSTLNNIKSKKWEWLLSTEEEMKVCLSHIQPNTEEIVKKHQAQVSH